MGPRRKGRELVGECSLHRHRDRGDDRRRVGQMGLDVHGTRGGPGEGLEVEGVAAAEAVQLVAQRAGQVVVEQLEGFVLGQRVEVETDHRRGPGRGLEHRFERLRELGRTERHHRQHPAPWRAPQQVRDQLRRRAVGPMQVVEREHHRALSAQRLQQHPHRLMGPVALRRQRPRRMLDQPGQCREHPRQLGHLDHQAVEITAIHRGQIVVESVDEHPERVPLHELRRPPAEHQITPPLRLRGQLGDQPGLADPLLPGELEAHPDHPTPDRPTRPVAHLARPAARPGLPCSPARHNLITRHDAHTRR